MRLPRGILNQLMQLLRSEAERGSASIPNDARGMVRALRMMNRGRNAALDLQEKAMFRDGLHPALGHDQLPTPIMTVRSPEGDHRVFFNSQDDAENWAQQNVFDIARVGRNQEGHYVDLRPGNDLDIPENRLVDVHYMADNPDMNRTRMGLDADLAKLFNIERSAFGGGKLNAFGGGLIGGGALIDALNRRQS